MKKITGLLIALLLNFYGGAQSIHTDLVYQVKQPLKRTARAPVLIMLHGYGSNENDLLPLSAPLDESLLVFSLRAPQALKQGGFCWYSLEFLPDQKFRYVYSQAQESRARILAFISQACKAYGADSSNVFLMGFSQGAIMAYDIALTAPLKVKGIVALSGGMMPESKLIKTDWAQVAQVDFFIAHGSADPVIRISDGEDAKVFLQSKKCMKLQWQSYNMPHTISAAEMEDLKTWLSKTIKEQTAGKK